MAFDRKVFTASDLFPAAYWKVCETFWMTIDGVKAGCCAFQRDIDFQEDLREDGWNPSKKKTLYIATTGLLPDYQGQGLGALLKAWEIAWARRNGFTRIVTNTRGRNKRMIDLNLRFGFRIVRTTPRYYAEPTDSTVVMELKLPKQAGRMKGPKSKSAIL